MIRAALIAVALLLPAVANAQSAAMPVIPGHLSLTGCPGAQVPCFIPEVQDLPLGYQQITSMSATTSLTVPIGANIAVVRTEAQSVRWRDDGTAPTSSVGIPMLTADPPYVFSGDLAVLQFIQVTSGAILNVSYYK